MQKRDFARSTHQALALLSLSLPHYTEFTQFFAESLSFQVDTSVTWGMLQLIIELSTQQQGAITRVARMLKVIGHKVELFNTYREQVPMVRQMKEACFDVHAYSCERNEPEWNKSPIDAEAAIEALWKPLARKYKLTILDIDGAFERIEKLSQLASAQQVKQNAHIDEVTKLQRFLSLSSETFSDQAKLPCVILPPAKTARFYDRDNIIARIDSHFETDSNPAELRSLALWGLGGVGKSHIALKYAHGKVKELDAILWIYSDTPVAIAQSFTVIATRLQLPDTKPQGHAENRILVLNWLQQTSSKWLLVFDNVEDSELLLEYWPVSSHGHALVTTRNHSLLFEPVQTGVEVFCFDREAGSQFLLHLLKMDVIKDLSAGETKSAIDLSEKLSGHALAISQMAGLIHRRSWSITEFLSIYEDNLKKKQGPHGLSEALDAVWQLSFESLDTKCSALLGVLSYVSPDSIPQAFFSEVLEDLLVLALVKRDKETRTLSVHRLVQMQFKYFMGPTDQQQAFYNTTLLLANAFPKDDSIKGQLYDRWEQCRLYLQHVLSLKNICKGDQLATEGIKPNPEFCELLNSCARYLIETASYEELTDVVKTSLSAFNSLESSRKDQSQLAIIYNQNALSYAHKGDFELGEKFLRYANDIIAMATPINLEQLSWNESNLGNVTAAAKKYEQALEWQVKAENTRRRAGGHDNMIRASAVMNQNMGRSLYLLGRFEEAHARLKTALQQLSESQNWAMIA
ncbi:hypothetical protein MMC17_008898 [Xylographa soralifera]|nr:hypothetical protein [Xylographa soralifera]